jgi:hypothetical protein
MKKKYLLILLIVLVTGIHAQTFDWAKREGLYEYDYGYGITTDPSGNVYVAGKYEMNANFSGTILPDRGNHDIYLARYTTAGDLTWITTAGGSLGDYAEAIYCDGSNVYIGGEIEGYGETIVFDNTTTTLTCVGDNDVFIAKYDLNGVLLWARSAGGYKSDKALGITVDNNGNVYACGYFKDTASFNGTVIMGSGDRDIFVAKYNSNGDFQWVRHAGSPGRDEAKSIVCDALGNVYITGMHSDGTNFGSTTLASPNGYVNLFLAKYAPDGSLVYAKTAGSDYDDVGWSLTMDAAGKIYIAGEYNAYALFDAIPLTTSGQAEIFVTCYDASGNAQWASTAGGALIDRARGIGTDGNNLYITGQFSMSATFGSYTVTGVDSSEIFMAKLNNLGTFEWAIAVGGPPDSLELLSYESGNAICADAQGDVYATGALLTGGVFGNISFNPYSRTDAFITKITQGADVTAPMVAIYSPVDNSVDVANNANLVLTFNEPVQKGTGNIIVKEGGTITQTIDVAGASVSIANNVVTIDAADFTANAAVNVEMATGVFKDMANNNYTGIADATTWNFTVTTTTGIKNSPSDESIVIYPNPSIGTFTVKVNDRAADNIRITITDCIGQVVYKKLYKSAAELNIDLSAEKKGVYFIEINADNRSIARKKIMVQ